MAKELFKTTIDLEVSLKMKKKGAFKKAVSSYLDELEEFGSPYFGDLRGLVLKQPDLLYGLSVLASEGVNKNKDTFLRNTLARIYQTIRHKFVDYEHDPEGEDPKGGNPENYQIVGHVYDSQLVVQGTGQQIPDHEAFIAEDGKWFAEDSPFRNQPLDVQVAWVLYKFQYPELAEEVLKLSAEDPGRFGVSMEILFNDYKFRIGGMVDPTESFDFDGNTLGVTEVRKGDPLADMLQDGWNEGKNRVYKGLPVVRILGGDIFFSGMAITKNRANSRSWNLSVASVADSAIKAEKEETKEFTSLLKAVSSRSKDFDINECKIVNGEPDCDCITKAVSAEITTLQDEINKLLESISAIRTQNAKANDEDEEDDTYNAIKEIESGLIRANKKLQNLYENNVDNDLSKQEVLEFLEEIEDLLTNEDLSVD